MAEVRAAVGADRLNPGYAEFAVCVFFDGAGNGFFGKAGPAAARIKFGRRFEELGAAADAVVAAVGPYGFIFTGVGALGSRVPCDFKSYSFCAFLEQKGFPLGVCFLDFYGHVQAFERG